MKIRYGLGLMIVLAIVAMSVSAQYVKATRWQYTWPKVIQYSSTTSCKMNNPIQQSDSCYRDGVRQCHVDNSGTCYSNCVRNVQNICLSTKRLPSCTVSSSFDKQFTSSSDCSRAALDFCGKNCVTSQDKRDCTGRAQSMCSRIGRIFI